MSALTILNSPAKEVLLVKLNMETQKECYYVISDVNGQEVCTGRCAVQDKLMPIAVDFLHRGIYLFSLVHKSEFLMHSFVKA
ncbi:MAG: hypothetical protein IPN29_00420 [Saprospiraceae bacterium]|nr:hypothetical protein [Saprospiraceae bacterium]